MKILILRPDNIGDVVLFSGTLKHLRKLYPDDHITLAVKDNIKNLVEFCPYVDRVTSIEELKWRLSWLDKTTLPGKSRLKRVINKLNKYYNTISNPYNLIIYPVKSPKLVHLKILNILSAKKVLGITGCSVNEPPTGYPSNLHPKELISIHYDVSDEDPWKHELYLNLYFLKFAGCNVDNINEIMPEFWLSESDNYLAGKLNNFQTIIGIFPGASSENKCWDSGNYAEFARLTEDSPMYVIFGSSSDKELASQVEASLRRGCSEAKIINLAGKTSLRELVSCIMSCSLFVGMDSCGLHIAVASDIPSVGITGGWHSGRFFPWGDPEKHILLTQKKDCFRCKKICKKRHVECIQDVTPKDVANAVNKLLNTNFKKVKYL